MSTITAPTPQQQRLRKFIRQPEQLASRQITDKGLEAVSIIERYRIIPTSLLVRLMSGGQRNNYRNLQTLFHKGIINRFALPKYGGPGEFLYYLDNNKSLGLLIDAGLLKITSDADLQKKKQIIDANRERNFAGLHKDLDSQGRALYVRHELMVSRFHAMLELACKKLGNVELETWRQGPELWGRVQTPQMKPNGTNPVTGRQHWQELDRLEDLPQRPDALFTLHFPRHSADRQRSTFLYEADRRTENTTRFKKKLRAHYQFIVSQKLHRTMYGVQNIRAVLIESTNMNWAHQLREAAKENIVSSKPSPLFWFTTSELFLKPDPEATEPRPLPAYLKQPEVVFKRIWASPAEDKFLNLAD